jgi:hypothetical protein
MVVSADVMDKAHAALKAAVASYLKTQTALDRLNNFDERMSISEARLYQGDASTQCQIIARQLHEICRDYLFLQRVSEIKIKYVLIGLQQSIEDKNPIVEFALLRSLIEHLASFCFQVDVIEQLEGKSIGQASDKKISEIFTSCRRTIERLFYGTGFSAEATHKRFHVNDFLRALERLVPDIERAYVYLCDFVHPNYGSNLLVSTGALGHGHLDPPSDTHIEHLTLACAYALKALMEVERLARSGGSALIRLSNYIEIAMAPHQRVSAIFVHRPLICEGDGKNKERAIMFTKARTPSEAVDMIYRYLETNNIQTTGPKSIGGIEGGFIFDIFPTTRGPIWFKTQMKTL